MMRMLNMMQILLLLVLSGQIPGGHGVYYGTLVGPWENPTHQIEGVVYIVDRTKIFIKGFNYDGLAPDAYFLFDKTEEPNERGIMILDEFGREERLQRYQNKDILLSLPPTKTVSDIRWLSVWCRVAAANLASLKFPVNPVIPEVAELGTFSELAHQVSSGGVSLPNSRTIMIANFIYDGYGPDAFFVLGKGDIVRYDPETTIKIPDENGGTGKLSRYLEKTITLTVPEGINIADYQWLSVYCILFSEEFGSVKIRNGLVLPPYLPPEVTQPTTPTPASSDILPNCETLDEDLRVAWDVNDTYLIIELMGAIEENDYMSFGLSGQPDQNQMDDADVAVVFIKDGIPHAVDYRLNQRGLCSNGRGVCPDVSQGGFDDIQVVSGSIQDGITRVRYTRKLNTGDENDKEIAVTEEVAVVWGLGRRNQDDLATRHYKRSPGTKKLVFKRNPVNNCTPLVEPKSTPAASVVWQSASISGEDSKVFKVRIGQSGGPRGYDGITGNVGWGIAYYINEKLIPELTVKRGETYTFIVETGNDPGNTANYHPLYITDDSIGGYAQLNSTQAQRSKQFAGLDESRRPLAAAVGRLCVYERANLTVDSSVTSDSFEEFFKTLRLECVPGIRGIFSWTPDDETPDLLYYQCYTHRYFGWKIHVVDEFEGATTKKPDVTSTDKNNNNHRPVSTTVGTSAAPRVSYTGSANNKPMATAVGAMDNDVSKAVMQTTAPRVLVICGFWILFLTKVL